MTKSTLKSGGKSVILDVWHLTPIREYYTEFKACLVILDEFELRLGREPGWGLVPGVLAPPLGPGGRLGLT